MTWHRTPLLVLLALAWSLGCTSPSSAPRSSLDLFNPRLGPAYSQWLVGPIWRLATPEEIEAFLALPDDAAAKSFVGDFWEHRSGMASGSLLSIQALFERRAEEADRRFSEAGYLGRRTDRGTIFVLYGEPEEITYGDASLDDPRTVEMWRYPADAPPGLDDEPPDRLYRFIADGDQTIFYRGAFGIPSRSRRP